MEKHPSEKEVLTEEQCHAWLIGRYSLHPSILVFGLLLFLIYAGLIAVLVSLAQNHIFSCLCMALFGLVVCTILFEGSVAILRYIWVKKGNYTVYRDVVNSKKIRRRRTGRRYSYTTDYIFCLSYTGKYIIPSDNFPGTDHHMKQEDLYTSVIPGEEVFLFVLPNRYVAMLCPMRYFVPPREPKDPPDWGKSGDFGTPNG